MPLVTSKNACGEPENKAELNDNRAERFAAVGLKKQLSVYEVPETTAVLID
jgi:hypothetical protein